MAWKATGNEVRQMCALEYMRRLTEAIAQEWLGTYSDFGEEFQERVAVEERPDGEGEAEPAPEPGPCSVMRQIRALEEANGILDDDPEPPRDAFSLDARMQRLLLARRGFDEPLGRMLLEMVESKLWRVLGYGTLQAYCRERLGMSARSVRQRVWMERKMRDMPEIREALRSGKLTWSKALLVAKDATPSNVEERIDAGEAVARMSMHFISVWEEHLQREKKKHRKSRAEVLMRAGGLCAVPTCRRDATHEHHIRWRSRGGPDARWNRVGLCALCRLPDYADLAVLASVGSSSNAA